MRKASGYFLPAWKPTGLVTHPQTVSPLAPLKENCSDSPMRMAASASWLTWVSCETPEPSRPTVYSSTGEIRVSRP